jgi:hypothetical protein
MLFHRSPGLRQLTSNFSAQIRHSRLPWIIDHVNQIGRVISFSWVWTHAREGRPLGAYCLLHRKHLHKVVPEIRSKRRQAKGNAQCCLCCRRLRRVWGPDRRSPVQLGRSFILFPTQGHVEKLLVRHCCCSHSSSMLLFTPRLSAIEYLPTTNLSKLVNLFPGT